MLADQHPTIRESPLHSAALGRIWYGQKVRLILESVLTFRDCSLRLQRHYLHRTRAIPTVVVTSGFVRSLTGTFKMTTEDLGDHGPSRGEEKNVLVSKSGSISLSTTASHAVVAGENFLMDRALEKKLLRKLDMHILPMLALMYLFK